MEIGYEAGSWELVEWGDEQLCSHMSRFFAKRANLRDFGAVMPLIRGFVLIHL